MTFKCSGCGLCCLHVDRAVEMTKMSPELNFPYTWDDSGKCEMLDDDHKCKIYDDRPLLCNVERFAEVFNLDKEEFYKVNEQACEDLQREAHLE